MNTWGIERGTLVLKTEKKTNHFFTEICRIRTRDLRSVWPRTNHQPVWLIQFFFQDVYIALQLFFFKGFTTYPLFTFLFKTCPATCPHFLKGLSTLWSMYSGILSMGRDPPLVVLALNKAICILSDAVTLDCNVPWNAPGMIAFCPECLHVLVFVARTY